MQKSVAYDWLEKNNTGEINQMRKIILLIACVGLTLIANGTFAYKNLFDNTVKVSTYNDTYILPYYYTFSPDYKAFPGDKNPGGQKLQHQEMKFQLSFKAPIIGMFDQRLQLYVAYTQLSYWQFYAKQSQYFRSTDYEPAVFLRINAFFRDKDTFDLGVVHESNGEGVPKERSWNRAFFDYTLHYKKFSLSIKPWVLIAKSKSSDVHNLDIVDYMGHGRFLLSYNYNKYLGASFMYRSFKHPTYEATISFPLGLKFFKGYVQFFDGYGQSLLEYNHRTKAVGIGIALVV